MAFVGEAILSAVIETLVDKLASSDLLQFARQENVLADMKKWEKTLLKIRAVLDDAEEKQLTSRLVKMWLDDLTDLAYDVEDILDEFATEALGRKSIIAETQPSKVWRLVPSCCTSFTATAVKFNVKMRSKIEDITSRLQDISTQKNDLQLLQYIAAGRPSTNREILPTTCFIDESRVCGRETDKAAILDLLLHDHEPSDDAVAVRVIAIIGMGGVGKTTLAQLAFNDDKSKTHFDLRVWACVSDDFDVLRVTKTILRPVTSDVSDVDDLNQLQLKLKEQLSGKKFLLVLDDVWNQNYDKWDILYAPLRSGGAKGSRVIVTTRDQGVVSAIEANSAYPLKELSDDECLSLFAQQALGTRNFVNHPHLRVVGEEIVKKCKGLPLAAKALGGMLRRKQNSDAWEDILKSKIWDLPDQENNIILPALKLSYHHLPSHLKRCFAYCSIFPKDYEFEVDELVLLWMGEGFVQQVRGQKQMEKKGTDFFNELLARSFFQQSNDTPSQFVMHDLVHDLAQYVAGDVCFNLEEKIENSKHHTISERARHSSVFPQHYEIASKFEAFDKVKLSLRTFLVLPTNIYGRWERAYISQKVLHNLLMSMGCLRVLSLAGYNVREVPDSIGRLKHLRYLNFSNCSIDRLPDSVGDLYNLQTLILRDCGELIRLPKGIGKLINLRHLDITRTSKLQEMSFQAGNLTNLQTLSRFIVSKSGGSGIEELKNLSDLRGLLSISKLHEIVKVKDARDANLKAKQKMVELIMEWDDKFCDSQNGVDELQVLESLQPHKNLEKLKVAFYGGSKIPSWIGDPSFSKMVSLTLQDCTKCKLLPTLGGLPLLEVLHIQGMWEVKSIGAEFYGESMNPFASLKELRFECMPKWESWSHSNLMKENMRAFPNLEMFVIRECPKLMGGLPKCLPSLVKLQVSECPELGSGPKLERISRLNCLSTDDARYLVALQELEIKYCGGVTCLWDEESQVVLSNLRILRINCCAEMDKLSNGLQSVMPRLEVLEIERCPKLESISGTGWPSRLRNLWVIDCESLRALPQNFNSWAALESLRILDCPSLICFPKGELPTTLKHLAISRCENLESLPEGIMIPCNSTSNCSSLEYLCVSGCTSLKSFPTAATGGELQLPSTIKRLVISCCSNLSSIPENMFANNTSLECMHLCGYPNLKTLSGECLGLNSLKVLWIYDCEGLERFPVRGGLSTPNLTELHINGCQNLKSLPHQMRNLKSLGQLHIFKCPGLKSFPEGGLPPNITSFEIGCCVNLKTPLSEWGLQSLTSLSQLTIENMFPGMVSFTDEDCLLLPISLTSLTIKAMETLASLALQNLVSLTSLEIREMKSLTSLPLQNLVSLTSLTIREMTSLTSLPVQTLISLRTLSISDCPCLRSLGLMPATLGRLEIWDCPIIEERCLKDKGEYWPIIAHIPYIHVREKTSIEGGIFVGLNNITFLPSSN